MAHGIMALCLRSLTESIRPGDSILSQIKNANDKTRPKTRDTRTGAEFQEYLDAEIEATTAILSELGISQ